MAINIAIDGPSASGKSTISKRLCQLLGYTHLDTGAMYRCVALYAKNNNVDIENEKVLRKMLNEVNIVLDPNGKVFLNNDDVTDKIREADMSMLASNISAKLCVRQFLVAAQQKMAEDKGFVMDGRDIGTVVLPNAELKIYMVASVDARAKRRYLENQTRGIDTNLLTLKREIIDRDYQDMHRQNSPLRKADDAIEIDTSNMTIEEVTNCLYDLVKEKLA